MELPDGVPGVNAPGPTSYEEFWPYYVSQHLHPATRAVHVTGTSLGVVSALVGAATATLWLLAAAPVIGYGLAFTSHFVIEKNKPATFGHPLWSLRADGRQVVRFFSGRLADDVAAVRSAIGLAPDAVTLADVRAA